ncbi:hypothetical protein [Solidesulfovibrio sp.]
MSLQPLIDWEFAKKTNTMLLKTRFAVCAVVWMLALAGSAAAHETAIKPGSGVAAVRLTHPGLWLVRAEMKGAPADGSVDQEVLRATLTFFVQ